ncbi:virulence associated protein B [Crinalium epipsammum PCC 9333]|uniref:Virulence associated protein B n=1 Tax=Crinalium epipsammum PCC 9333 TaxID=1173022 RepID=K9W5Q7_9CYAN|nr:virulence associated protein B [Crinalium epipsammum]AFZ14815.1 virulence associated protein B [Crinalium epipsammum PCC 9333]
MLTTAKVQTDGKQQSIILPENYHLNGDEVYIKKIGDVITLIDKDNSWQSLFDSLPLFTDDFMATLEQLPVETREELFE